MVLAGGHSLLPMMKLRLAHPEALIDINGLANSPRSGWSRACVSARWSGTPNCWLLPSSLAPADPARRRTVIADPIVRNRARSAARCARPTL